MSWETQLRHAMHTLRDCERIVVCEPESADRIRDLLAAYDMRHLWTVRPSPLCAPGHVYLIDGNALRNSLAVGFHNGPGIVIHPPRTQE